MILDRIRNSDDSIIIRESGGVRVMLTPYKMKIIVTRLYKDRSLLSFRIIYGHPIEMVFHYRNNVFTGKSLGLTVDPHSYTIHFNDKAVRFKSRIINYVL